MKFNLKHFLFMVFGEVSQNVVNSYAKHDEYMTEYLRENTKSGIHPNKAKNNINYIGFEYMKRNVGISSNLCLDMLTNIIKSFDGDGEDFRAKLTMLICKSNIHFLYDKNKKSLIVVIREISRDVAVGGNGKLLNIIVDTFKNYDVKFNEYYVPGGYKAVLINRNGNFTGNYERYNLIDKQEAVCNYGYNNRAMMEVDASIFSNSITHISMTELDLSNVDIDDDGVDYTKLDNFDEYINNSELFGMKGILTGSHEKACITEPICVSDLIEYKEPIL